MDNNLRCALFADADGTLIETISGKTFPVDNNDWTFRSDVIKSLKLIMNAENSPLLFIITNQGGIEQGYNNHFELRKKFDTIKDHLLTGYNIKVEEVLMSPYSSYHYTRKPYPEFAYRMAIKYQLDLKNSLMIGDASGIKLPSYVYRVASGEWKYSDTLGSKKIVNEEDIAKIEETENGRHVIYKRNDFSNSDYMFAVNSGMKYLDVEKFASLSVPNFHNLLFYAHK